MKRRLWGRASSVNVQKVLWTLDELGLAYSRIDAGGRYGQVDTDAFARLNPNRRVPVLEEDGFALWESHAIMRYLAGDPEGPLAAPPQARALADQWMEFTVTTVQPPFLGLFWQRVRLAPDQRDEAAARPHQAALDAALGLLDAQLRAHDWLSGGAFGLADIAAGSLMHRITDLDLADAQLAGLHRWHGALKDRPGYQAHIATSYEELRGA